MSYLSFLEKEMACRLFGISGGYVFSYWTTNGYNKNTTKSLILDSCGINIYEDEEYKGLSQQKCIEKIWDTESPKTIANLLSALCDYFNYKMGFDDWSPEDQSDYREIKKIIARLQNMEYLELPQDTPTNLKILLDDINANIKNGKPEMVLDRLHTFSTEFFRNICRNHGIAIVNNQGNNLPLHSLVGTLKNWYQNNHYFESDFCVTAIQNSISVFEKFNAIRNDHSAAHPNSILNRTEAEYVIRIIADTLVFINKIESIQKNKNNSSIEDSTIWLEDELPFT